MRTTLLALAIAISGMTGILQASPAVRHHSVHKVKKGRPAAHKAKRAAVLPLRTLPPGALAGRAAIASVPLLPGTPALGPTSLVHLERILPLEGLAPVPTDAMPSDGEIPRASAATPTLAGMRKVVPEEDQAEDLVLPSGDSAALPFEPADRDDLDLLWPVETRTISSAWGPRVRTRVVRVRTARHSRKVLRRFLGSHKGVDLSAPQGSDIFAAMDGVVIASARHKQYGNFVAVDHGNGVVTLYAHCSRNFVQEGDVVRRGQKIAEVGRTGNATGPHLHFELRLDGIPQNPLPKMNDTEEIPSELMAQNHEAVPPSAGR
jgi:hypothetical protein